MDSHSQPAAEPRSMEERPTGLDAKTQIPDSIEVPETQYEEVTDVQSVPTKTGDEVVNKTQLDAERPRTAGSAYSINTNFEETEDGVLLAQIMGQHHNDTGTRPVSPPADTASFLIPSVTTNDPMNGAEESFVFGKPNQPHFDMTGTRKGPAAGFKIRTDTIEDRQPQMADSSNVEKTPHATQPALPAEADALPTSHKQKRKKMKRRRCDTGTAEVISPQGQYENLNVNFTPTAGAQSYNALSLDHGEGPAHGITVEGALHYDNQIHPSEADARAPEHPTPEHQVRVVQDEHEDIPPRDQSINDLRAGAWMQEQAQNLAHDHELSQYPQLPQTADWQAYKSTSFATVPVSPQDRPQNQSARDDGGQRATSGQIPSIHGTANAMKRKSKSRRKTNALAPVEDVQSDHSASDVDDYMQILAYKFQEKSKASASKWAVERDAIISELQQVLDAKQTLQDELDLVRQEKSTIATQSAHQKAKLKIYEAKVNKFKVFVDGLGNDVDWLKKGALATRRQGEQLRQENDDRRAEQLELFKQLSDCTEKAHQLKNDALKGFQYAQADLQTASLHNEHLQKQLSERVGLLAEERDRRAQLEKQLAGVANSDAAVLQSLKTNRDAVLDKLYEIHAMVEDTESRDQSTEMVKNAMAAIQALTSQHSANADDIISVKGIVESLSESVTGVIESTNAAEDGEQSNINALQTHLDDALQSLKTDIDTREKNLRQDATHREAISALQAELNANAAQLSRERNNCSTAKSEIDGLTRQIDTLRVNIAALQAPAPSREANEVQLSAARSELDAKTRALEASRADLAGKEEDLRKLSTANISVKEQLQIVQRNLVEANTRIAAFDFEKSSVERNHVANIEKLRNEMSEHAHNSYMKTKMTADNSLKNLASQRDNLQQQIRPLQEEVATTKASLEQLHKESTQVITEKDGQLEGLKKQTETHEQEVKALQASLMDLRSQVKGEESGKEQSGQLAKQLAKQLTAEKAQHRTVVEERTALAKRVEEIQRALEQMQSSDEEAKVQLQKMASEKEAESEKMRAQLAEAQKEARRADAGREQHAESSRAKIEEEQKRSQARINELQDRLAEAQKQVRGKHEEAQQYQASIQKAWESEESAHKEQINTMKAQAAEIRESNNKVLAENERLRNELGDLKQHTIPAVHSSKGSDTSKTFRVPSIREDITPMASNKENEPPRPRKDLDRSTSATSETAPVPVLGALKRTESRNEESHLTQSNERGPVVEESQPRGLIAQFHPNSQHHPPGRHRSNYSDGDEMLDSASQRAKRPPAVVEETQQVDQLPSFSNFHDSLALSQASSSGISVPTLGDARAQDQPLRGSNTSLEPALVNGAAMGRQASDESAINNDLLRRGSSFRSSGSDAHSVIRDNLTRSQREQDKYTFRKSYPIPNSASKMVHRESEKETLRRRRSDMNGASTLHESIVRGEGRDSLSGSIHPPKSANSLATESSSPGFMDDTATSHKTKYHTPGDLGVTKRRASRNSVVTTADPRLAGREVQRPLKRKSADNSVEDYEEARKKRVSKEPRMPTTEQSRYSLRANRSQPSINDLPSMPVTSGRASSNARSTSSRMRTLAGSSTCGKQGTRKMSKKDEVNARFAQELDV